MKLFAGFIAFLILLQPLSARQDEKKQPAQMQPGDGKGATFFGDKIVSKRVIFIIDRSGSMKEPSDWKPELETGGKGSGEKPKGKRKIDIAKFELKRAIRDLSPDAIFSVIFYSDSFTVWKEQLVVASDANKEEAIKAVEALEAVGGTNIFDPLEKGFKMKPKDDPQAAKGPKGFGTDLSSGADTIYLLSDGLPNRGQITNPADIRARVKEMNKEAMITINAIAFGRDANEDLMKGLADDTGGKYLKR